MRYAFWALWIIDALVAAVFVYFFLIGIGDHTVSSFNIGLWLGILAILGAILGGTLFLRAKNFTKVALAVLCLIAIPALGLGLIMVSTLIFNPRWN